MSQFFPIPQLIKLNKDIELEVFECQNTTFQFASIAPQARLESHQHIESQFGMVLKGILEININGEKTTMKPLNHVYVANSQVVHSAVNPLREIIRSIDVKRINYLSSEKQILEPTIDEDTLTELSCQSITGSWFKISILKIPSGFTIPEHQREEEEIGFILNGEFNVTIENEEQCLQDGQIYYAPSKALHKGYNSSEQEISLVRIWINQN